ncbi:MAG: HEAT repeat domain-containing protein [Candidatus Heimdallarchaeota archaeon]
MSDTRKIVITDLMKSRVASFSINESEKYFSIYGIYIDKIPNVCEILIELLQNENFLIRFKSAWILERLYFTERISDDTIIRKIDKIITYYNEEQDIYTKYYLAEILYLAVVHRNLDHRQDILLELDIDKIKKEREFNPFFWYKNIKFVDSEKSNRKPALISVNHCSLLISDKRLERELLFALTSGDEKIKYDVIEALSRIKSKSAVKLIEEIYNQEEDKNKRTELLICLSRIEGMDSHWYKTLDKISTHTEMSSRLKKIISTLKKELREPIKRKEVKYHLVSPEINQILNNLEFMNKYEKINAMKQIGQRGPENMGASKKLEDLLLNDSDEMVRLEAARTLAKICSPFTHRIMDQVLTNPKNVIIKQDLLVAAQSMLVTTRKTDAELLLDNIDTPKIFLAFIIEDESKVNEIYSNLSRGDKYDIYMFLENKIAGEKFEKANVKRIEEYDFFIGCFSQNTASKTRTLFHQEVKLALKESSNRNPDSIYFIPIKLDECKIPDYVVKSERASDFTYVKYSDPNVYRDIRKSIDTELIRRKKIEKESINNKSHQKTLQ